MNINYGDNNLIVRYLQMFLQENYSKSLRVSGIYDEYTHSNLIKYLSLPNVEDSNTVYNKLLEQFQDITYYFTANKNNSIIRFISKSSGTREELHKYMCWIRGDENIEGYEQPVDIKFYDFIESLGWKVTEYINTVSGADRYQITITTGNRVNRFPNKDMMSMINISQDRYLHSYNIVNGIVTKITHQVLLGDINSDGKIDEVDRELLVKLINKTPIEGSYNITAANIVQDYDYKTGIAPIIDNKDLEKLDKYLRGEISSLGLSNDYKLALISCEPDTEYMIAHKYSDIINMTISCTDTIIGAIENGTLISKKLEDNVETTYTEEIYLDRGDYYTYRTGPKSRTIIIQLQYDENISNKYTVVVPLKRGDINLDGKVDSADRQLLWEYLNGKRTLNEKQLVAANIDQVSVLLGDINLDGKVDKIDRDLLKRYIDGEITLEDIDEDETKHQDILARANIVRDYTTDSENNIIPLIDEKDLAKLDKYLNGSIATLEDGLVDNNDLIALDRYLDPNAIDKQPLGIVEYAQEVDNYTNESEMILVTPVLSDNDSYSKENLPSYADNPWLVHDKFINYLLDMSITPYSREEDIRHLQTMVDMIYPGIDKGYSGIYNDKLREVVRKYQKSKNLQFATGYLDVETEKMMIIDISNKGQEVIPYESRL